MRSSPARLVVVAAVVLGLACGRSSLAAAEVPAPKTDLHQGAEKGSRTVVLAMGCFWCAEGIFEQVEGVTDVTSGYAGGTPETAHYELVGEGGTGHAESIRITYDPSRITYGKLLQIFFTTHDPTTKDRQGPDWGHQYRSAIFFASPEEQAVATAYIKQLNDNKIFSSPVVTTVEPLAGFYPAEAYHQDYIQRHPDHPYVKMWFPAKNKKLHDHFASLLKKDAR